MALTFKTLFWGTLGGISALALVVAVWIVRTTAGATGWDPVSFFHHYAAILVVWFLAIAVFAAGFYLASVVHRRLRRPSRA